MSPRLSDLLVHRFDADLRRRGRSDFEAGAVVLTESEPGFALAEVHEKDQAIRDVGLRWSADAKSFSAACTCEAFKRTKSCQHLWSALLAVDASQNGAAPSAERGRAARRGDEPWKKRLASCTISSPARDATPGRTCAPARGAWPTSPIRARASRAAICACGSSRRNRLKSGAWGVRRPFDAARSPVEELEDALDRLVLGSLRAGDVGLDDFDEEQGGREILLNAAQRELLIERLCRSGRLFLESTARAEEEPLGFDDGPPWAPVFTLERDEHGREARIVGWFARGEARMELEEPALLFEEGWLCARGAFARFQAHGALDLILELRREGPLRAPLELEAELQASLLEAPGSARIVGGVPAVIEGLVPRPQLRVRAPRPGNEGELDCFCPSTTTACRSTAPTRAGWSSASRPRASRPARCRRSCAATSRPRRPAWRSSWPAAELGPLGRRRARRLDRGARAAGDRDRSLGARLERRRAGQALPARGRDEAARQERIDWFDLEGGLDFEGQVASMPALLAAARKGANVVQLGDGSVGLLPEDGSRAGAARGLG
jgi:hypothetical protein